MSHNLWMTIQVIPNISLFIEVTLLWMFLYNIPDHKLFQCRLLGMQLLHCRVWTASNIIGKSRLFSKMSITMQDIKFELSIQLFIFKYYRVQNTSTLITSTFFFDVDVALIHSSAITSTPPSQLRFF